jgi:hypothetical protein
MYSQLAKERRIYRREEEEDGARRRNFYMSIQIARIQLLKKEEYI